MESALYFRDARYRCFRPAVLAAGHFLACGVWMRFEEMLPILRKSPLLVARRADWPPTWFLSMDDGELVKTEPINLSDEDIVADDWEIY